MFYFPHDYSQEKYCLTSIADCSAINTKITDNLREKTGFTGFVPFFLFWASITIE